MPPDNQDSNTGSNGAGGSTTPPQGSDGVAAQLRQVSEELATTKAKLESIAQET